MKKSIFTLLVVFASMTAFAQFEQGTMLVGGEFGLEFDTHKTKFNNSTSTDGKSTSFSLNPNFGYFVIDNLAVGAEIGLSLSSYKPDGNDSKSSSTAITFGPFARYYFEPGIYVQAAYGLGSMKQKYDFMGDVEEDKYALSAWSLGAGYALFLNDNVAVEPMIGYQSVGQKTKTTGEPEAKDIAAGLFLRVGFQIYLR